MGQAANRPQWVRDKTFVEETSLGSRLLHAHMCLNRRMCFAASAVGMAIVGPAAHLTAAKVASLGAPLGKLAFTLWVGAAAAFTATREDGIVEHQQSSTEVLFLVPWCPGGSFSMLSGRRREID